MVRIYQDPVGWPIHLFGLHEFRRRPCCVSWFLKVSGELTNHGLTLGGRGKQKLLQAFMKSHNMRFCFSNAHEFMWLSVVWFVTCCNFIELTTVIKWASVSLSVSAVCDEQVDWCGELCSCYSLGNCGCALCGSFYNCIWVSERSSESSEVKAWVQCSWFTTILQRFCVLASWRTWWCFIRRPTFLKDAKDKARGQNQHMAIPGDVQVRLQCPLWHHKNHHQKLQKGWNILYFPCCSFIHSLRFL